MGAPPPPRSAPLRRPAGQPPDIVVVGAGNFGIWTALNLVRLGATVTVLDAYGPGNSRSTSGGETRGVRSSYGGRPEGFVWNRWANEAIRRWIQWDEEGQELLLPRVFYQTGDLILREEMIPYLEDTMAQWDRLGVGYELLDVDEINYRWPWIRTEEGISLGLHEPNAGVVRARRAIESVAKRFEMEGGEIRIARAAPGGSDGRRLNDVTLGGDESLAASTFVFAVGPWMGKTFPELFGDRIRIPVGNVFYFAVPDRRFMFPNMPSYGVPGCTGWPALGPDHRGFRVRVGGQAGDDPDTSDRWVPPEAHERPREILERYFPDLVGAAVNETRACHYCFGPSRNFLIDKHPDFDNVWLAGLGTAESFKQGPVLGEYIAKRVLEIEDDPGTGRTVQVLARGARRPGAGAGPGGSGRLSVRRFLPTAVLASIAAAAAVAGCYGPLQLTPSDHATVLAEQSLDADHPALPGPYRVSRLYYGSGTDQRRPEYRDSVSIVTETVDASKLVSLGASARRTERLLGLHAEGIPDQRTRMVSRGRGPLPAGPHRSREPRHEGLLRPRIRLSRRVARQPGLRVRLRRHEFHQRRHPQRERRARLVPPQAHRRLQGIRGGRIHPVPRQDRLRPHRPHRSFPRGRSGRARGGLQPAVPVSGRRFPRVRLQPRDPRDHRHRARRRTVPSHGTLRARREYQLHGLPRVARRRRDELSRLAPL